MRCQNIDFDDVDGAEAKVRAFVRDVIIPYEVDARLGTHGPADDLVDEMRGKAREAGLLTPQVSESDAHMPWRDAARILRAAGYSPLGPTALNVAAPDEGNVNMLSKVATSEQQARFLEPLIDGRARSAFLMTEPAEEGGAGSDPSMLQTTAKRDGDDWVINGRKSFVTGAAGASVGIIMARTENAATMFLTDLPDAAVKIERILDTIDSSMPGGHAVITIDGLRVPSANVLGAVDEGFRYAQVRLAPARLTHCMRWLGAADRAQDIAVDYACRREAFGKRLIDHEGVGFALADNKIDLKQCELLIDWCAGVLDAGEPGTTESSMTKATVAETLFKVADRSVQAMGGTGVSADTVVAWIFRELRAFRIYDGPTEVHKWSLAKKIKREYLSSA